MSQESIEKPLRIRLLTDGNAGNVTQAMGLAEALARRLPAEIAARVVRLRPIWDRLPNPALARLPIRAIADPDFLAGSETLDLAIGAGRRGNLAAAAIRRLHGVRAVAILHPQMPLDAFDLVIEPEHDARSGPNLATTIGAMHRLTPERLAAAGAALALPPLPSPRLALLIGGPSRSARFERPELDRLIADLGRFQGWSLMATPSRRTPDWAAPLLRAALPGLWLWDGSGPNPYPGLLAHADAVLVTEDSVNMASEAGATGKPVFVSGLGRVQKKLARFHESLRTRGITRPAAAGPAHWTYPVLDEAGRMADMLLAHFGFSSPPSLPI